MLTAVNVFRNNTFASFASYNCEGSIKISYNIKVDILIEPWKIFGIIKRHTKINGGK